jgi:hypothetical protein
MFGNIDKSKILQFVCLDGKDGGNVLKCFGIPKYWKTTIPYSFCDIETNCDLFVPSFLLAIIPCVYFFILINILSLNQGCLSFVFWLKNLHMVKRFFTFDCCYKRKTMLECLFLWKCKWKMVVNCLLVSIY